MYRPRLKSSGGCLRCKQRKIKCDELRPTCSSCRRWSFKCSWPEDSAKVAGKRSTNRESPRHTSGLSSQDQPIVLHQAPNYQTNGLDPFYQFPSATKLNENQIPKYIHQFFATIKHNNLPFEDVGIENKVVHGWFESAISERAVCYAFLTQWANLRVESSEGVELRLKLENRTNALIRFRVETKSSITEHLLLAAALHFMSVAINVCDEMQLRGMLHGIKALMEHLGGFDHMVATMRTGTIFAVQHTDIFNSLVTADPLSFVELVPPERPPSFSSVYLERASQDRLNLMDAFDTEILNAMENIEFLLYFRTPSRQTRGLSREEVSYIYELEYWTTYQLCLLQSKYVNSGSMSEVMVTGLIVVKLDIVAEACHHGICVRALLKRLRRAILSCELIQRTAHQTTESPDLVALWACFATTVGKVLLTERKWFVDYIRESLAFRPLVAHQDESRDEVNRLHAAMQQFPWHSRLEDNFIRVCRA